MRHIVDLSPYRRTWVCRTCGSFFAAWDAACYHAFAGVSTGRHPRWVGESLVVDVYGRAWEWAGERWVPYDGRTGNVPRPVRPPVGPQRDAR